ncbi:ketopantoate reductase family protein [Maribrevibacterium harenarium]|uniref:2-dehydropantoate 2-reductase n=1 Tax=Maribrevibacterium harenarium TaxID=2589817 RepID=A0A501X4Y1_9GAMM|nr:2-dehydropantoate 2-reductase [Maribrevibacterium harenarium]TPE55566.1 ketopantoate reductase family protein [Maribrevibacterium harenarium]
MNKHWLVIGCGALGMRWAARLLEQGHQVTLLHRYQTHPTEISVEDSSGIKQSYQPNFATSASLTSKFEQVLICTKAYDALPAFLDIKSLTRKSADIVCLCNGFGAQQELIPHLKEHQSLWAGVTNEGTLKINDSSIRLTGEGDTFIGVLHSPTSRPNPLEDFHCANIECRLLEKLAINAVINPLTAIFGVTNGEILQTPVRNIFDAAVAEIKSCYRDQGFPHHPITKELDLEMLGNRIATVAHMTGLNHSSMLQDIRLKRKTEVDYICGYFAKQEQIECPLQDLLYEAINNPAELESYQRKLLNFF